MACLSDEDDLIDELNSKISVHVELRLDIDNFKIYASPDVYSRLLKSSFGTNQRFANAGSAGYSTLYYQSKAGNHQVCVLMGCTNLLFVASEAKYRFIREKIGIGGDYKEKYIKYKLDKDFEDAIFGAEDKCLQQSATSCEDAMTKAGSQQEMATSAYVKLVNSASTLLHLVGAKLSYILSMLLKPRLR